MTKSVTSKADKCPFKMRKMWNICPDERTLLTISESCCKISYAGYDGGWPKQLKGAFCVPRKLSGRKIIPDPEFFRFDERREFCKKFDGYPEFCDPAYVDDKLKTVGVADTFLQGHAIFDTPLIIVPGLNHNALVRTLETTLMQPGIKQNNVIGFHVGDFCCLGKSDWD